MVLDAGDWVTTDTYFGVVPTGKWRRHTTVGEVEIVAGVTGDVEVEAVHNRAGHGERVVAVGRSTAGLERGRAQLCDSTSSSRDTCSSVCVPTATDRASAR